MTLALETGANHEHNACVIKKTDSPHPVAPASTGNAGAHFEAAVGAYYLLTMVAGGEPRGLPGANINAVSFQQRMATHPLDDVVVIGTNADGSAATLEIQVKRSLTFTASDTEFADLVNQMWAAAQKLEFSSTRYELAAAISRTTTRVEHSVQEVLRWARVQDSDSFHANILRNGFASDQMRDFVKVFRANLKKCGAPDDDMTVWKLLERFQVLLFDFEAGGSAFRHFAQEQSRYALIPNQAGRGADLWNGLINDAAGTGSAAGARTRQQIVEKFGREGGYQFAPEPANRPVFARLAEEARFALRDVDDQIGGARLSRAALVEKCNAALFSAPLLNITGAPGTGKSMVLKRLVELSQEQGRVMVLRGGRIVGGGWLQFAHVLGITSSPEQFFTDLAAAGGATLFVDNIDQIDDPRERATISDLLKIAADFPGWRVIVTTTEGGNEWTEVLPESFRAGTAILSVPEISDDEAKFLSDQNTAIADLLRPDHPARRIARNLFYLARLVSAGSESARTISTETDLARLWWGYGGGRDADNGRFSRLKAIRKMGAEFLAHPGRPATKADDLDSPVVIELLKLNVVREEVRGAEIAFRHDVYRDWTVGLMIADDLQQLHQLSKKSSAPTAVIRGLELAARLKLDADPTGEHWVRLLSDVSGENVHGSWRRPILLALPRSEKALAHFRALEPKLLANDGALVAELVRFLVVVDSMHLSDIFSKLRPDVEIPSGAVDFVCPKGPAWWPTISWLANAATKLPPPVIPDVTKAFMAWLMLTSGLGTDFPLNKNIVAVLFDWLELLGDTMQPRSFQAGEILPAPLNIPHLKDAYELVRMAAFSFAVVNPHAARSYIAKLTQSNVPHRDFEDIVRGRGAVAKAAPSEFVDFFMAGIVDPDDDNRYSGSLDRGPFGYHEHIFIDARPAQGPMLEMLQHSRVDGLAMVRRIVEHATDWRRKQYHRDKAQFPCFTVPFTWGEQSFEGDELIYRWARSSYPSTLTTSALMALEAWGHERIDANDDPVIVLRDILGPDGSSCALIAVALDIVLSHWSKFEDVAWPFAASPDVLLLDDARYVRDLVGVDDFNMYPESETNGVVSRAQLTLRSSRKSRMTNTFGRYIFGRKEDIGPLLRAALEQAFKEIPKPLRNEDANLLHGLFAVARRAARMADPTNWQDVKGVQADGVEVNLIGYVPDEAEQKQIDARSIEVNTLTSRANMMAAIALAFDDDAKATPQLIIDAVSWAKAEPLSLKVDEEERDFDIEQTERTVVMSAVLAVRHVNAEDQPATFDWAESVLQKATNEPDEKRYRAPHVRYDAKAIAAVGLMALYEKSADRALRPNLLKLATSRHASIVNALAGGFKWLRLNDPRFLLSIIRVLLLTSSYVRERYEESENNRLAQRAALIERGVAMELAWLESDNSEPAWPEIAPWLVRPRRQLLLPGSATMEPQPRRSPRAQELYADENRLSLVSSRLVSLAVGDRPEWLIDLTKHLSTWAIEANGPDEDGRDGDGRPFTFNGHFFEYLGILVAALPHDEATTAFIEPILTLPEEACVDLIATLLRGFDIAVNSTDATKPNDLFALRGVFAARIQQTRGYQHFKWEKSFNCEMHLSDALCAIFYQASRAMRLGPPPPPRPPSDFLPVMPTLTKLVLGAPTSGYIAVLFLDLVERSHNPSILPFALNAVMAWCGAYGADTGFWNNHDVGSRACAWFTKALTEGASMTANQQTELRSALDILVKTGIVSARALEDLIDRTPDPKVKASGAI
jgi:hypothetical protein